APPITSISIPFGGQDDWDGGHGFHREGAKAGERTYREGAKNKTQWYMYRGSEKRIRWIQRELKSPRLRVFASSRLRGKICSALRKSGPARYPPLSCERSEGPALSSQFRPAGADPSLRSGLTGDGESLQCAP